jgi:hypothetical protein
MGPMPSNQQRTDAGLRWPTVPLVRCMRFEGSPIAVADWPRIELVQVAVALNLPGGVVNFIAIISCRLRLISCVMHAVVEILHIVARYINRQTAC